jgi:hypothetical protein
MDAQDTVLDRYPHAEAREEPPIFQHGVSAPIERGCWEIHPREDVYGEPLGIGKTESKAWEDAARKLRRTEAA